jgi:hypothetical protein
MEGCMYTCPLTRRASLKEKKERKEKKGGGLERQRRVLAC